MKDRTFYFLTESRNTSLNTYLSVVDDAFGKKYLEYYDEELSIPFKPFPAFISEVTFLLKRTPLLAHYGLPPDKEHDFRLWQDHFIVSTELKDLLISSQAGDFDVIKINVIAGTGVVPLKKNYWAIKLNSYLDCVNQELSLIRELNAEGAIKNFTECGFAEVQVGNSVHKYFQVGMYCNHFAFRTLKRVTLDKSKIPESKLIFAPEFLYAAILVGDAFIEMLKAFDVDFNGFWLLGLYEPTAQFNQRMREAIA